MQILLPHAAAIAGSKVGRAFASIRRPLTLDTARTIQLADLVFGVSAGAVLAIGLLRVFYSVPFLAKLQVARMDIRATVYRRERSEHASKQRRRPVGGLDANLRGLRCSLVGQPDVGADEVDHEDFQPLAAAPPS